MDEKKTISVQQFMQKFGTEAQCRQYLFDKRWPNGFVCPRCAGQKYSYLSNGFLQCSRCRHQTSVTVGTALHKSHLPLTKWFEAFYIAWQNNRYISTAEIQTRFGVTYKTALYIKTRIYKTLAQYSEDRYSMERSQILLDIEQRNNDTERMSAAI